MTFIYACQWMTAVYVRCGRYAPLALGASSQRALLRSEDYAQAFIAATWTCLLLKRLVKYLITNTQSLR